MRSALRNPDLVYQRRWLTLLVLCISLIVITLDNTILNVAIPTLAHTKGQGGLGATASQLQWIVDAYTLVFAGLLLTAGSLGDRFGRYRFLAIGLAIFGVGSLLSAFAPSANVLIGTRALMGIGAAFIMPSTLSIITNVFTDPAERGKAIGVWAGVSALGIGLGPITGGFLLEHFWWGSIFIVNVPIVIVGLVLGFMLIPESSDPAHSALDPVGAVLSIVALGSILWAVIEAPAHGWGSPEILAGFVVGFAVLGAFLTWELKLEPPDARHALLREPAVQRGQRCDHAGVPVPVRHAVPADPIPAVGPRLLDRRGGRGAAASGRRSLMIFAPAFERVGAEVRQQDRCDRRPPARRRLVRAVPHVERRAPAWASWSP